MKTTARQRRRALVYLLSVALAAGAASCADEGAPDEVYFCAQEPGTCSSVVVDLIGGAGSTIECAIYSFTDDEIAQAMVAAVGRGVTVWVLYEKGQASSADTIDLLEQGGVHVRPDGNSASMHHKFVVVDGRAVASGSFNFTNNGNWKNDENLMVFHSPDLAGRFSSEFRRVWEEGQ